LRVDGGSKLRPVLGDPRQQGLAAILAVCTVEPELRTGKPVRLGLLARCPGARFHGHQRLPEALLKV
jgi:hypothetical protein